MAIRLPFFFHIHSANVIRHVTASNTPKKHRWRGNLLVCFWEFFQQHLFMPCYHRSFCRGVIADERSPHQFMRQLLWTNSHGLIGIFTVTVAQNCDKPKLSPWRLTNILANQVAIVQQHHSLPGSPFHLLIYTGLLYFLNRHRHTMVREIEIPMRTFHHVVV